MSEQYDIKALVDQIYHLRTQLAEKDAENERLKAEKEQWEPQWRSVAEANAAGYNEHLSTLAASEARERRYIEALESISKLKTKTIMGDPADYDFNAEDAHEAGANKAFCEAASIADEALATNQGGESGG